MSEPLVRLSGVSVDYGAVRAVHRVELDIVRHALTALVGPSGCGKTSLLRLIAGFEHPSAGSVTIDGRIVAGNGAWVEPNHRHLGMVFQQGALFPHLNVWRNVLFGVKSDPLAEQKARAALQLVGLSDLVGRYPDELSGGQQQRVALARALAPSPKLVLLDEPFANLDASLRGRVREEMLSVLRATGITALIVTHDQQEALSIADVVAVMHDGRLLQTGSPGDVYHRPATPEVAEFIGEGQLLQCTMRDGSVHSPLGELRCEVPDGVGRLLVRPEEIDALTSPAPGALPAQVKLRRYFGHDALDEVVLPAGLPLRVRRSSSAAPQENVWVRLNRDVYPLYPSSGGMVLARSESAAAAPPPQWPL
jgi:iron(III) transport system ATP-binding protein